MNSSMMTQSSRFPRLSALLAKLGLKPRLTRFRPENRAKITKGITNRVKRPLTGKGTKMNDESIGVELEEVEAVITEAEAVTEVVIAPVAETPAEPVYDGPMEITTRKAKASDGKNGRGRGVRVCIATTPTDAEKIVERLKISTPATEIVVSSKYTAPTFVTAEEWIAAQDHAAALNARIAEIIKSKNLSAEELALLQGSGN